MATTSMERQDPHNERLERGEKVLVFGIMTALAVEGLFAIVGPAMRHSMLGIVWGVVSFVFVMVLANFLYAGNRTAHKIGTAWAAFQIVLSLVVLLVLAFTPEAVETTRHVALPTVWMAAIKLLAYIVLCSSLLLAPRVRDFLDVKRGAELKSENPLAPTGVEVTFAADQKQVIGSLGTLLKTAAVVLLIVGILQALVSLREFMNIANYSTGPVLQTLALWLVMRFLPAVATISIGIVMFPPAAAAKLVRTQGTDMSYLMNVLMKLRGFFFCLIILVAMQLLGLVVGVPLR